MQIISKKKMKRNYFHVSVQKSPTKNVQNYTINYSIVGTHYISLNQYINSSY